MNTPTPADTLRALLRQPGRSTMPCGFDACPANLIDQTGAKQVMERHETMQRIKTAAVCHGAYHSARAGQ